MGRTDSSAVNPSRTSTGWFVYLGWAHRRRAARGLGYSWAGLRACDLPGDTRTWPGGLRGPRALVTPGPIDLDFPLIHLDSDLLGASLEQGRVRASDAVVQGAHH